MNNDLEQFKPSTKIQLTKAATWISRVRQQNPFMKEAKTCDEVISQLLAAIELKESTTPQPTHTEQVNSPNIPMQPLYIDNFGTLRFKPNAIVDHLLNAYGMDMNALARMPFTNEDRMQFAQLIGYSLGGYSELSYVTDESYERAIAAAPKPESE